MRHLVQLPKRAVVALNAETKKEGYSVRCDFKASAIDLSGDSENAYVVTDLNSGCIGADNVHYWIVVREQSRYRIIFHEGCSDLDILKTKTNGFYDIQSFWGAGSHWSERIYKYRDGSYKLSRSRRGTFNDEGKPIPYPSNRP